MSYTKFIRFKKEPSCPRVWNLKVNTDRFCFSLATQLLPFRFVFSKMYYDGLFVIADFFLIGFTYSNNAWTIFTEEEIKKHLRESGYYDRNKK